MFGSSTIDIAIGVVFVFLSVSLVCTAINEVIASAFRRRQSYLERGIRNLVDGHSILVKGIKDNSWGSRVFRHQLINALSLDGKKPAYIPCKTFTTALLHLVAQDAGVGMGVGGNATPRALSGQATFDQIRSAIEKISNKVLKEALLPLLEEARTDSNPGLSPMASFQASVSDWYNAAMDRVSGWYKRSTRINLLLLGIAIALTGNIDTIRVSCALSNDPTLRASIVSLAGNYVKTHSTSQPSPEKACVTDLDQSVQDLGQSVNRLTSLGIPIGWVPWSQVHESLQSQNFAQRIADKQKSLTELEEKAKPIDDPQRRLVIDEELAREQASLQNLLGLQKQSMSAHQNEVAYDVFLLRVPWAAFVMKMTGIFLTGAAASLGAPFWFDVLSKVMSVRATGKTGDEEDAQKIVSLRPPLTAGQPASSSSSRRSPTPANMIIPSNLVVPINAPQQGMPGGGSDSASLSREQIQVRAYQLSEQHPGRDAMENWIQAEKEVANQ